ncbi:MAG TPA: PspC domain-containing protein [Candidatus Deferrimicrobium sp.]|nr:PspC domain-containing protein [Candidatus Deferrimicrobium sp.]
MKRLYKSRKNKMLTGVCGGIAEYFDVDPVLVRILFIIFTIFGGFGVLAYIIGAIIIPYSPLEPGEIPGTYSSAQTPPDQENPVAPGKNNAALFVGIILVALGAYFLMRNIPLFHDFYWWVHWHIHDYIAPTILILIGIALLIKSKRS